MDAELSELLASAGAVVIEGPKACGKAMTASQLAASHVLLDIDQAAQPGQFLLTGSAVPAEDASRHTGTGRFAFCGYGP